MSENGFSARTVPWMIHDVKEIDEAVTAAEAIRLAGLDFEVAVRKDGYQTAAGNWRVDPSKRKIVRVDTEEPFGTVSPTYQTLQYSEAFEFMDELHDPSTDESIRPHFVAAGPLDGGRQAFVVVEAPLHQKLLVLDGEDPHDLYVVLRSSHNGRRAVEVNLLPLRDKCTNMTPLPSFGKDAKQRWAIRHTKNLKEKMLQAKDVLTNLDGYAKGYDEMATRLAAIDVDIDAARDLIAKTIPDHIKQPEKQTDQILSVYEGSTLNGYQGTAWGVLNGITEYYDHHRGRDDRSTETRWVQGLDGATTQAIDRAVQVLTHG